MYSSTKSVAQSTSVKASRKNTKAEMSRLCMTLVALILLPFVMNERREGEEHSKTMKDVVEGKRSAASWPPKCITKVTPRCNRVHFRGKVVEVCLYRITKACYSINDVFD